MVNNTLDLLRANVGNVVVIVLFILTLVVLYKKGRTGNVKRIVRSLVVKMEERYGSGTGEIKYNEVVAGVYKALPSLVIFFLTEKELDNMIEVAVDWMKKCLEDEKNITISKGDLRK